MKLITSSILMIRPAAFGYNEETAKNNSFQNVPSESEEIIKNKAKGEFDALVLELRANGVDVFVVEDSLTHIKPDAVFPNNWISTHEDGSVVTYSMCSMLRRKERRRNVIESIRKKYLIKKQIHFEGSELNSVFLEGTGSMVLDRVNKIVYANRSIRTDEGLLEEWCKELNYSSIVFDALDRNGSPIYHTNVIMALGEAFCILCTDSIPDGAEKTKLLASLKSCKRELIPISLLQMEQFAGNMLQVYSQTEGPLLVMSTGAYRSLNQEQLDKIHQSSKIIHSDLTTIETYGGGSARCMMAELFLEPIA